MKRNLLILTLILALPALGLADRRSYVWTYQYQTIPKGVTEIEFYQTTKLREPVDVWEYRIEVEHGLTERWDLSVYQIFQQTEGIPLRWDAVQFR